MIIGFQFHGAFPKLQEGLFSKEEGEDPDAGKCWEITVARAAPRTPMWNPKIKTGSRIMLEIAPISTESIPVFANPWL